MTDDSYESNLIKVLISSTERYGVTNQIVKTIEEISELQQSLCKYILNKTTNNVAEEVADVEIMLEQVKFNLNLTEEVIKTKQHKLKRLYKVLKDGVNSGNNR